MKNIKMLIPNGVNEFQCIGNRCEDNCCSNWSIHVDKPTYKKYRNLNDKQMKSMLEKSVKRNRKSTSDYDYAKIKLNEDGTCPLMLCDKLCYIHKNLGEEHLCSTCKTYPRQYNIINGIIEKNLTLSCPEVARIILLNENGIDFYFEENTDELSKEYVKSKNTNLESLKTIGAKYFWELRTFVIEILQDRTLSIEERLVMLGMFINKLDENITYEKLIDLIKEYQTYRHNETFKGVLNKFNYNYNYNLQFITHMSNSTLKTKNMEYINIMKKTAEGLKFKIDDVDSSVIYKEGIDNEYRNFKNSYEYILENYLVNYVYKSLFLVNKKNPLDCYAELVVKFSMIKLNLIGISKYNQQKLTKEDAVNIIYSFSRFADHDRYVLKNIIEYLEVNQLKTLPHMVSLIGE
ncbi:MAG: flagellin lysine-N-methylase [Romboutsia sp.]|nr:flagellin lysine-N-methylase [Romboutsia sp.]